ncbi:PIG-X-domain-containing protein [Cucurbitaria berberidis CBS 394.84]|uniref:Protein PBN1 n=1 Tax=Cucurbitaria berberidis CBS 394.84 TaxID=1168544 RepID=A0A9P4LDN7_9PLEO|nr:PIG-X-domain-containing protein [Cucurbitaria berberidis CBS 394.84]KAF1851018.1 PIG-X-domain-containing protein [Cucurbitaria berberidis CBS 394.84]
MKQRITYVVKNPEAFTPEQLVVKDDGTKFTLQRVHAAKEHRITLGLDELPRELSRVFQQWHEFHIRWASSTAYTATPPFTSRVSPGLHIFFTPLKSTPEDALCSQLHDLLSTDLKCSSNASAIKLPVLSERFSMSASSQYFDYLESPVKVIDDFQQKFCKVENEVCGNLTKQLLTAAYVDIDYDTISRAVVLTAAWPDAQGNEGWSEDIELPKKDSTVEIGVLSHEPNSDPEDVQFGGFLTVLGQDSAPKPARFQTPTRHYPLIQSSSSTTATPKLHPLTYTTSFSQPTGLHPTLILSLPKEHLAPPNPSCKLHTHLTLPSYLFIDKYQFNDALFLQSKNLKRLRSIAGATDLEAPDWVINQWGSAALFELAHPPPSTEQKDTASASWNVSIPLHLRYLPASPSSHARVPVPWPVVFWACRADEGAKMAANPFDRVHLGYEALFGPRTRFMHVEPSGQGNGTRQLVEWIDVPVLDTTKTGWVEAGTVGTVLVAFLGLCWVLFGKVGGGQKVVEKGKKKQ